MIYIDDLKENYEDLNLPEEFVMCLPSRCSDCGAPLVMSETLTGLHCSNPKCGSKIVMRIRQICKDMNVLGFGEANIEKFVEYYHVVNPLNMFELQLGMPLCNGMSQEVADKIIQQIIDKKHFQLWEYVKVANIPFVRTSARPIFTGYKNLTEAFKDIESGGVGFIMKKLGLVGDEDGVSVQAMKIYTSLMENKEDLLENEKDVYIISTEGKKDLAVVCSDQVGGRWHTKPEFYAYVKEHFGDRYNISFLNSASKKINYLVWAGADGSPARYTSKVQKVEGYNAKGSNIPIVTGEQFVKLLEDGQV